MACDWLVFLCFQHRYWHSRGTELQASLGFSSQFPRGSRHNILSPVSSSSSPVMFAEHLCVSVSQLPQEKAQQCLQGGGGCSIVLCKGGLSADPRCQGTHTPCRPVTCPTCRHSVRAEKVQSQLYPFQSSHGTSPTGSNPKTLKSQVAQESLP